MANTLTQVGIETGNIVEAYHVTQSIDAFTGTVDYDIFLSGSFNMTGSINGEPGVINPLTASYAITASYAVTTSYAETASYAVSASYEINYETSSSYAETASIAISASYVNLVAGPNITINQLGDSFEISSSAGGGSIDTGSFYYSSSINSNTITFYQGDGTSENVIIDVTGSISPTITQFGGVNIVTVTSQTYTIPNSGSYRIIQNYSTTSTCDIFMPPVGAVGDIIEILENNTSKTRINVNGAIGTGQQIQFGSLATTNDSTGEVTTRAASASDNQTYIKMICTNSGSSANVGQRWRIVEVTSDYTFDYTNTTTDPRAAISLA